MRKVIAHRTSRRSCRQAVLWGYQQPVLGPIPSKGNALGLLLAMSKEFKSAKEVGVEIFWFLSRIILLEQSSPLYLGIHGCAWSLCWLGFALPVSRLWVKFPL